MKERTDGLRVLIVNSILIGDASATGDTMENMLVGISGVEYLQFCIDDRPDEHSSLADAVFLSRHDMPVVCAARFGQSLYRVLTGKQDNHARDLRSSSPPRGGGGLMQGLADSSYVRISGRTSRRIRQFRPEVIYTMGGSIRVLRMALKMSKHLQIPIVFHGMDDWRASFYTGSWAARPFSVYLRLLLRRVHSRSIVNLAISPEMADVYSREYRRRYLVAGNCVKTMVPVDSNRQSANELRVVFSGGLHFNRWKSLITVKDVIEQLAQDGVDVRLQIHAPERHLLLYGPELTGSRSRVLPYTPRELQLSNLANADVLLHVESPEESDLEYMKLSFSTKIVDYLAAGRPILVYGSEDVSTARFVVNSGVGWGVNTPKELAELLSKLMQDPSRLEVASRRSRLLAETQFGVESVQMRILTAFQESAGAARARRGLHRC